jgi:hypothetical protein
MAWECHAFTSGQVLVFERVAWGNFGLAKEDPDELR